MSSHTEPLQAASTPTPKRTLFWQGMMAMMPLSIAVIPWGLLAGSMAMNTGLSVAQAIAMSAVIFAGAAQLVSLGLGDGGRIVSPPSW
jgi:predicted branched-subunit amino acid permease